MKNNENSLAIVTSMVENAFPETFDPKYCSNIVVNVIVAENCANT